MCSFTLKHPFETRWLMQYWSCIATGQVIQSSMCHNVSSVIQHLWSCICRSHTRVGCAESCRCPLSNTLKTLDSMCVPVEGALFGRQKQPVNSQKPSSSINVSTLHSFMPLCLGTDTICNPCALVIPGTGSPPPPSS